MALEFTTTSKSASQHGVKMLVYGKAGRGKTYLCSTAPSPLIISAEAGLLSLADFDIPVIEIKTVDELLECYKFVTESEHAKQFETICLDSITEIAEVVLSNAKKLVKDPRQAYGELIERMNEVIKSFRDLPGKHVYMSAKQEYIKDESNGRMAYGPAMPGQKLSQQIPYLFDELFQLDTNKTPEGEAFRYLRTAADFQYDAKDRSGKLDAVEAPNLTHIINKIMARKS